VDILEVSPLLVCFHFSSWMSAGLSPFFRLVHLSVGDLNNNVMCGLYGKKI